MNKIKPIIALFFLLPILCLSQSKREKELMNDYSIWLSKRDSIVLPIKDNKVTFEQVDSIKTQGITKGDLVTAFKSALSDVLNQAKSAIDIDDREGGLVIAKVYDSYVFIYNKKLIYRPLKYTIKFHSKDDRFRIQITNIEIGIETTVFTSYTIDTKTEYSDIEKRESLISSFRNYKTLTKEGKERSLLIKEGLKNHIEKTLAGLVILTAKKANDDF